MKSEVYSWRLSPELKVALEAAALREGSPLAALLDRIASLWLSEHGAGSTHEQVQRHLHASARECIGTIQGGDPVRSRQVRERIRARLRAKRRR